MTTHDDSATHLLHAWKGYVLRVLANDAMLKDLDSGQKELAAFLGEYFVEPEDEATADRIRRNFPCAAEWVPSAEFRSAFRVHESRRSLFILDEVCEPAYYCIPKDKWDAFRCSLSNQPH